MKLLAKSLNRYKSLKENFGEQYFTVKEALECLQTAKGKEHECYDILKTLEKHGILSRQQLANNQPLQYKFLPTATITERPIKALPPITPYKPKEASLPNVMIINGVKYVRLDRITEVLMDQL